MIFDVFKGEPALPDYVRVVRSKRRTVSMQIAPDATVIVRAPLKMSGRDIARFVLEHEGWIQKHRSRRLAASQSAIEPFSEGEIRAMTQRMAEIIPERVEHYAALLGVSYGRITIRCQKTRWGSCSSRGNLNFNCLLSACPAEVLDSVVAHELCHRLEMNHSDRFYSRLLRVCPNYYECRAWLKKNGPALMARAHSDL